MSSWWDDLNTPDDFRSNWYGAATNQIGHTFVGMVCAQLFCDVWFLFGDAGMPVRTWAFMAVFIPYGVVIELLVQKSLFRDGPDPWFDWLMWGFGVAGTLLPFLEVAHRPGVSVLEYEPATRLTIFGTWAAVLIPYVAVRYIRQKRGGDANAHH